MFGDERASAKEISLFFYVASVPGLSGFLDNETGHARANSGHPTSDSCKSRNYWVSSHTSNFSTISHSDPEIRRWGCTGARAETHPTHDLWKALT